MNIVVSIELSIHMLYPRDSQNQFEYNEHYLI